MTQPADPPAPAEATHRKQRRRRSRPVLWGRSAPELAIWAISAVAAVGGALAPGRPTGWAAVDLVLRAGFAGGLAAVTPRARRWTWLVLAGVAAAASGPHLGAAAGWLALAVALVAAVVSRQRWLGAVVGGASAWALLRLPDLGPHGTTAAIAAVAVVPVLVSAYRRQRRTVRKRVLRVLAATAGLVVVAVGLLAVAGLTSTAAVQRGVDEARAGIDAAKAGDADAADAHLDASAAAFEEANARLDSWMTVPARLVPVVGQQAGALATMSSMGQDLAGLARDTTRDADYRGLALEGGQVDLARIVALQEPLATIDDGLARAADESQAVARDWLAPPLRDRFDELTDQIDTTRSEVDLARQALDVAPTLLGADGPRRYLILFTTPAEARGLGGFLGSWAELTADQGRLELTRRGRVAELLPAPDAPPRTLDAPADYLARYGPLHPETFPGDLTVSPDFPSVAAATDSVYRQVDGGGPLDGVIAVDPYGLAAMLEITGPITVEGMDEPLSAANAADFLIREQYLDFDTKAQRVDVLDEAAQQTFDAFIHTGNLQPARLAEVLGPAVEGRRILAFSRDPAAESLVERLGLSGAFPVPDEGDFFAVVNQNGGNNKIDAYLRRRVEYQASFDPTDGAVDATATVTLRNEVPSADLPDYVVANRETSGQPRGVNWTWFNFYSPHTLASMTIDGQPVAVGAQRELGVNVYQAYLPVPLQGEATVTLRLTGSIAPADEYRVRWYQQPLTHPDQLEITVSVPPPWFVDDPTAPEGTVPRITGEPQFSGPSSGDGELVVPLREVTP